MSSCSQLSPVSQRWVAVIIGVASGICVLIGAAFNVVSVATAYWVVVSTSYHSANVGLWRICDDDGECIDISNPSSLGINDKSAFIYASRALAIGAMALCLIYIPIAVAGFITKKKGLVFSAAVIIFIQSVCFTLALVVFFFCFIIILSIPLEGASTVPGWSFYVGGLGSFLHFVGGIALCISRAMLMRQRARDGPVTTTGAHNVGVSYTPLHEAPIPPAENF